VSVTYFKRFQMQVSLRHFTAPLPVLPTGYRMAPWHKDLLDAHVECKYHSFCEEIDATVFPCLGNLDGCDRLMREITSRDGFLPTATWLATYIAANGVVEPCGTIQALQTGFDEASIQNIGVVPRHRGLGIGTTLLIRALKEFRKEGLASACLEVTAENTDAVRLYQRYGFRTVRTVYKAAEVAYS